MSTLALQKRSSQTTQATMGSRSTRSSKGSSTGMPRAGMGFYTSTKLSICIPFSIFLLTNNITTLRNKLTNFSLAGSSMPAISGRSSPRSLTASFPQSITTNWTAGHRKTPPNGAERHFRALQPIEARRLHPVKLNAHRFQFQFRVITSKCIFSRSRSLILLSLSVFSNLVVMPFTISHVLTSDPRTDPWIYRWDIQGSQNPLSAIPTPPTTPSPHDIIPAAISPYPMPHAATTLTPAQITNQLYDGIRREYARHVPQALSWIILTSLPDIAGHPLSSLRRQGS